MPENRELVRKVVIDPDNFFLHLRHRIVAADELVAGRGRGEDTRVLCRITGTLWNIQQGQCVRVQQGRRNRIISTEIERRQRSGPAITQRLSCCRKRGLLGCRDLPPLPVRCSVLRRSSSPTWAIVSIVNVDFTINCSVLLRLKRSLAATTLANGLISNYET